MKIWIAFTTALLLMGATSVQVTAQPGQSLNMTLFDYVNPVDTAGEHSALWGYTAPNGREYACFGSPIGTFIYDITTKPIRKCAFIPGPKSSWREMKTYKNYLYVVTESRDPGLGLQIIDLSGLPNTATLARTDTALFLSAHTINIDKHYLFIMGTRGEAKANGGTIIYDLEPDPLHPVRLGATTEYYHHDSFARNDTLLGAAVYGQGCDIYNIADKANPVKLATITYPYSGTHNAELTQDGRYVCTTDEINFTPKSLKVWDIKDLNSIYKAADYSAVPNDIIHNVHIKGRYAFVAWYTAGVRVIDMIDPKHPREVAYYDTYPGSSGGYEGVWEEYPFFASGKIIASDRNTGLYVLQFNNATAGSFSGTVRDSVTGQPIVGATVTLFTNVDGPKTVTVTSDALGKYYAGGVNGDYSILTASRFGYRTKAQTPDINGDQQKDILLAPATMRQVVVTARDSATGQALQQFSYAVEPVFRSTNVTSGQAALMLPTADTFNVTVGRWGYMVKEVRVVVAAGSGPQQVVVDLKRGYYDNATLDLGWSLTDPSDKATTGQWVRIVPYHAFPGAGWFEPEYEPSGRAGGYVFITGAPVPGAPPQVNDVNNGTVTLTSPVMDLRTYANPYVGFDLWYGYFPHDSTRDSLMVQATNDDGLTWVTIFTYKEINKAGWSPQSIGLKGLIPLTDKMRVRYRASDSLGNSLVLTSMDNFRITDGPGSAVYDGRGGRAGSVLAMTAYPNPTHGGAQVNVFVPVATYGRLELYDQSGVRVMVLHDGLLQPGVQVFKAGSGLPSGAYLLRLTDNTGAGCALRLNVVQ